MRAIVSVFLAAAAFLCGCCNLIKRTECCEVVLGEERGSPYACSDHPYYCTTSVAKDCLAAPYYAVAGCDNIDWAKATLYLVATLTYPFWVVDEVCEVAADTVMFPVDAVWYWCIREG